jgi:hypothetical protein
MTMSNRSSQASFILLNPDAFRDQDKQVSNAREKAIETMENGVARLKDQSANVEFEISKAAGILGLLKKQLTGETECK